MTGARDLKDLEQRLNSVAANLAPFEKMRGLTTEQHGLTFRILGGHGDPADYERVMAQLLEDDRIKMVRNALRERQRRYLKQGRLRPPDVGDIAIEIVSYFPEELLPSELPHALLAEVHDPAFQIRDRARRVLATLGSYDGAAIRTRFAAYFAEWVARPVEEWDSSDEAEFRRSMRAELSGAPYEPILDEAERRRSRRHVPRPWETLSNW